MNIDFTFYEFFAGGGLARLGLGPGWRCLFANDIDQKKGRIYRENFRGFDRLLVEDIHNVRSDDLPERATLAWASFPCQDLSLAGNGRGIHAERSGTFWPFWELILDLEREGRKPPIVVIENVVGLLTANKGQDFTKLCATVSKADYTFGALVINADRFVPQSRPRLFIIAVDRGWAIPEELIQRTQDSPWHTNALIRAFSGLPKDVQRRWVWWKLPTPDTRVPPLNMLIEKEPTGVVWHSEAETERILSLMNDVHLGKVRNAQRTGKVHIGTIYRRTRQENDQSMQRAEVRFDGISGCLRTPAGGSSRQIVLVVNRDKIRSRLLSPREAARLMGVDDSYMLPENYNETYHLMGDAVVVPVISWLEKHLLRKLVLLQKEMDMESNVTVEIPDYSLRVA